jgi:RNA polymerase sigma-70 factor (ECF subfamily)
MDQRISARIDPSDIVQEAMAVACQRLTEYLADPPLSFYPWLRRIAWDRLIDAYRTHVSAERRSVLAEDRMELALNDESIIELVHGVAASTIGPCQQAIIAEMESRIAQCLNELKPQDREILVLRYLEQLSVPDIAETLSISHTAVTSRHLRAIERLRRLLRPSSKDDLP